MSDKNDEFNKKKNNDYVYAKYVNNWKESDEATDEMLGGLYNFDMMKESEKGKAKLMVSNEMIEVERLEVDLAREIKAKQAEHDKGKAKHGNGKAKQEEHDLDDVDLDALDLENRIKKLEEDFRRMLKAKEAKEAEEAELKANKGMLFVVLSQAFHLLSQVR
nr:hypothetical protein [Tanacetum cinerariifolium]